MAADPRTITIAGKEVPRVGLGTNRLTDTAENRSFLREAVEAGLRFIDTAHLYTGGDSERAIGNALGKRDDVLVATKGGFKGGGNQQLRAELENSFEALRTDRIDLYYLHRVDPDVEIEETMSLLRPYLEDGRIGALGLSDVDVDEIERARTVAPVAAVQNEHALAERKHESVIDHCAAEGIVFVPYYPLAGDSPQLEEVAKRHGATPHQVKVAWLLARASNVAPIPGTLSADHLRENLAALDLELSADELEAIGRV